jgi:hypothetical protein
MGEVGVRAHVRPTHLRAAICLILMASVLSLGTTAVGESPAPVQWAPEAESPRMPRAEQGAWRETVQLVWNGAASRLERRRYEVFDPFAEATFDIAWEPRHVDIDRAGPITGSGVLTWRRPGAIRFGAANIMAQYRGEMAQGRAHGRGIFVDRGGLRYDGDWSDGLMEGEGHLLLPNGDVYRGGFKAGRLHGQGLYIDAAGRVYEGGFLAGLRHGPAQVAELNGLVYASVWIRGVEDQLQRNPAPEGWAKLYRVEMRGPTDLAIPVGVGTGAPQFCCDDGGPVSFSYAATSFADRLEIYPDAPQLLDVWRGRANIAVASSADFGDLRRGSEEYSFFNYNSKYVKTVPLQFGLENRSTRPAAIVDAYLDVVRSEIDMQPALQSLELNPLIAQSLNFSIENYGWSPARNARLTIRFQNLAKSLRTDPIQIPIGEISGVHQFSFEPSVSQFGVRMKELPRIGEACTSGSNEMRQSCFAKLVRSGVFGRLSDFVIADSQRFGLRAVGQLEYEWTDADGRSQNSTAPFDALVPLGTFLSRAECEGADFYEIDGGQPFQLAESRARYRVPFPLHETVGAGTARRWRIMLDAAKSSHHDMRIVLVLADGREVTSRNISLLLLRPKQYPASIRPCGAALVRPHS